MIDAGKVRVTYNTINNYLCKFNILKNLDPRQIHCKEWSQGTRRNRLRSLAFPRMLLGHASLSLTLLVNFHQFPRPFLFIALFFQMVFLWKFHLKWDFCQISCACPSYYPFICPCPCYYPLMSYLHYLYLIKALAWAKALPVLVVSFLI